MPFAGVWTEEAAAEFERLRLAAEAAFQGRKGQRKSKPGKSEGLFKQVHTSVQKLLANPRHPGLQTHKYSSLENPYDKKQPVFEAYVQNRTPGAYRIFWCYDPDQAQITIIAITPHP